MLLHKSISALLLCIITAFGCAHEPIPPAYTATPLIPVKIFLSNAFLPAERPQAEEKARWIVASIMSRVFYKNFNAQFLVKGSIEYITLKTNGGAVLLELAEKKAEAISSQHPRAFTYIYTKEELNLSRYRNDDARHICGSSMGLLAQRGYAAAIVHLSDTTAGFCSTHEALHLLGGSHTTKKHTLLSENMLVIPSAWDIDDENKYVVQRRLNELFGEK